MIILTDLLFPAGVLYWKHPYYTQKQVRKIKYAFLSYSSDNAREAENLKALMEQSGIPVWMASEKILVGENFADIIPPAIDDCACFVLLLTEEAQRSAWVPKELDQAIRLKKPIIPVQLEQVPLSDGFYFSLIDCQIMTLERTGVNDPNTQAFIVAVKNGLEGKKPVVLRNNAAPHRGGFFQKPVVIIVVAALVFLLGTGFILSRFIRSNEKNSGKDWGLPSGPEQPATDVVDQIPEKYANEVLALEYSSSTLYDVSVKVGEYTTTQSSSVWTDCVIYSKDTRIAVGEGPLVKGVAPGETTVVVVSQTGTAVAYRIIVTE